MALNCSSRSLLVTDDCAGMMLGGGCWSEEASPLSSCGVNSLRRDELEPGELEEESDPVDLLPTDPFGMNLETSFTVAIASCIEDLTVMSGAGHFGNGGDDDLFADLSYYLNQAFAFPPEPWFGGYTGVFGGSFVSGGPSVGGGMDQFSRLPINASCSEPTVSMEYPSSSCEATSACRDTGDSTHVQEGNDAHEGMVFVLGYLGIRDILSVEMVCKSLRSAVQNEPFLWKCIHIDPRVGKKIHDVDLVRLTQKSQGSLQCLSLVGCINITDQGLKAVLESNLQLTKFGIFGASGITYQGLVNNLMSFNMVANIGIKKLRVSNRFTASEVQYKELLSLLRIDKGQALHKKEPRIYHANSLLPDVQAENVPDCFIPDVHDEYALDIEKCPRCPHYKLVYDCPSEECKTSGPIPCRGCIVCITRCKQCGRCIDTNNVFHETFLLESICPICQPLEDPLPPAEK